MRKYYFAPGAVYIPYAGSSYVIRLTTGVINGPMRVLARIIATNSMPLAIYVNVIIIAPECSTLILLDFQHIMLNIKVRQVHPMPGGHFKRALI